MGSYLSILNNTEDVWSVKLGADQAAINIATIAGTVVGAVGAAAVTCGAAAPLLTLAVSNGVVSVFGVSTAALATMASAAAVGGAVAGPAGAITGVVTKIAANVQTQVEHELGMDRLGPGQTKTYGKMSLSLWQQCMCVRSRVNPNDNREILVEVLYMRPIFSGATDKSNLTHDIHYWLNKNGVKVLGHKIRLE